MGEMPLPHGSETILLAEDEDGVRSMCLWLLSDLGYRVIDGANGAEALEKAKQFPDKIDLLLSDVVMPQMGGKELADQIKTLRPETKILFMSGYTNNVLDEHGILRDRVHLLSKPFSLEALATKLREVLGHEPHRNN